MSRSHSQSQGQVIDTTLNVAQTVPTLVIKHGTKDEEPVVLTQSIAALEYLDEAFPETISLLPVLHDAGARADVRRLVQVIAVDIHPLTTCRVSEALALFRGAERDGLVQTKESNWQLHWIRKGLAVYESLVSRTAGLYSVGDAITMADVCLMPQLWTARKFGFDITELPNVYGIFQRLSTVDAFQEDCHPTTVLHSDS